ncbi:MAG: hypothetical protein IKF42_00140 [Mogibacterium sp.]|nr:hypothetical protein [Mogibacterium sp.]
MNFEDCVNRIYSSESLQSINTLWRLETFYIDLLEGLQLGALFCSYHGTEGQVRRAVLLNTADNLIRDIRADEIKTRYNYSGSFSAAPVEDPDQEYERKKNRDRATEHLFNQIADKKSYDFSEYADLMRITLGQELYKGIIVVASAGALAE